MRQPLAFVHIPKCSGTAFEAYLQCSFDQLGARVRCLTGEAPEGGTETFEQYVEANRHSPFVFGHVPLGLFRKYYPDARVVTFLRDPVARTISNYRSWHDPRNFNGSDPHSRVASHELQVAMAFAQGASLDEFVSTKNAYVRAAALGDVQTKMLSTFDGSDMTGHLESAKRNIEAMPFFGLTERFSASIDLFRGIFLDAPEYAVAPQAENRSSVAIEQPSEDLIARIRTQVPCDTELYRFACGLFETRLQGQDLPRASLSDTVKARRGADTAELLGGCKHIERENAHLKARLEELSASYEQLSALYRDITSSRGWRLLESLHWLSGRIRGR
ncbi:sulfotransferase family protein [Thiocapsa marina]|uniref:Sulfotransferase n=1 Tax=Thiocapsa marina 5811 TaxID=768671 RepID=F9U6Z4_9GAMM|nr:sulfotransferase family 2 domain-containing protein [Thiocapsa marina]EGV20020.1 hypothetical protein ThimaDRAFT_0696 [Thiocapsa marina 5811]